MELVEINAENGTISSFVILPDMEGITGTPVRLLSNPAGGYYLIDPTTGEATEVISNTPVGEYLIRLPAASELPPESVVLSIKVEGEELVLTFVSELGFTHQLQRSTTSIAWADLGDPVAGDGSILEFRQNIVSIAAVELFRIRIDPSD